MATFVRQKKPGPIKPTPNPYPSRFQGWRQSLFFTFFLIVILGGSLRFYPPFFETFQQTLFETTLWAQSVFISPFQKGKSVFDQTLTFMEIQDELAQLRAENEKLKEQLQNLASLTHENQLFRTFLNVPETAPSERFTARVLSTPYDGLHHFLMINAGTQEGLKKDQAVITPEGVLGRIDTVGKHVSRVLLLNDANSRIPARTTQSNQKAILAGDGGFFPTLVYLEDTRNIEKGEAIVTSGFGGIFPEGLPLGRIEDINNGTVRVRLFATFQKLEWVQVIKSANPSLSEAVKTGLTVP